MGLFWELATNEKFLYISWWKTSWGGEDTEHLETADGKIVIELFANFWKLKQ